MKNLFGYAASLGRLEQNIVRIAVGTATETVLLGRTRAGQKIAELGQSDIDPGAVNLRVVGVGWLPGLVKAP